MIESSEAKNSVPEPLATLEALRPTDDSVEAPLLQRTIDMQVFERHDHYVIIGTLHDQRPWATGQLGPQDVHRMELGIVVRKSDLVIVDAAATMDTFPHAECPNIESEFSDLIGMSVSQGFSRAVQTRFGRERGCSHMEFLARALGPVVIQAVPTSAARRMEDAGVREPFGYVFPREMTNACHIWAEDGVAQQKLAAGWRPATDGYPSPTLVEIRQRKAPPVTSEDARG